MRRKAVLSACAGAVVCLGALSAEANDQSNRWFYAVSHEGRDVHLTLQLIEEDPPNFDTTFKLTRGDEIVFENRQFIREEADETVGPGVCIEDWFWDDPIDDCDGDGTDDCYGICGTAYRYEIIDECVPIDYGGYYLYDETTNDSVGTYTYEFEMADDPCLDSGDSGCSVTGVPDSTASAALAAFMLLIGVGFAVASRRGKNG